ncbi:MAG: DUF6089 family protein, partial [Bacteroidales bacterium]
MIQIRHVWLFFLVLVYSISVNAQVKEFDIGLFVGTSQYNGDVNMSKAYYSPHVSGGVFVKQVFNYHYSARYSVAYGELKGFDKDFDNAFQQLRNHSFRDNNVLEFSAVCEFNFFEVTPQRDEKNISPYLVGGLGVFFADELDWHQSFNFPMGVGVKFRIASRVEMGIDWVFRKTFTDKLDKMETLGEGYREYKQISFDTTNDWYSIASITFMICFLNPQSPCPVYYKKPYEL